MKQLTDEVLAQVRDALEMNRVMAQDSEGNYTKEVTPKKITAALAALDTAQPVQVHAMLLEALEAAEKLEHAALVALSEATDELKVGNTYTTATDTYKANNELIHRLDKILNLQYRDRKREARLAARQAQPERAPLSDAELKAIAESAADKIWPGAGGVGWTDKDTEYHREFYNGIKQGGQHD